MLCAHSKDPTHQKHRDKVEEATPSFIRRPIFLGIFTRTDILMYNDYIYMCVYYIIKFDMKGYDLKHQLCYYYYYYYYFESFM